MIGTMYKMTGRLTNEPKSLELIVTNMANGMTPGYKGKHLTTKTFTDAFGNLTQQSTPTQDHSAGPLKHTNRSLDFALRERGLFTVQRQDGSVVYTRNGCFKLNPEGELVTQEGFHVLSKGGGKIKFTAEDNLTTLKVNEDGSIIATDGKVTREVATLSISEPEDYAALIPVARTYFRAPDKLPITELKEPNLVNNALEGANISAITEMTRMIESVRSYETAKRVMSKLDDVIVKHQQMLK